MNDKEQTFIKDLIISADDIPCMERNLKSKGIVKHLLIKEKLLAWSETPEIRYTQIASVYRYDKRLRLVLYKYISYLEEFYRSIILDNYTVEAILRIKLVKDFKEKIIVKNDLNDALELLDFSSLLIQMQRLPSDKKALCGFPTKRLYENSKALKELRNAVMHNKFLLLYRNFEKCYVQGVDNGQSTTLKANIINLFAFLPQEVREKFKSDIMSCMEDRNLGQETKWDLPNFVCIVI